MTRTAQIEHADMTALRATVDALHADVEDIRDRSERGVESAGGAYVLAEMQRDRLDALTATVARQGEALRRLVDTLTADEDEAPSALWPLSGGESRLILAAIDAPAPDPAPAMSAGTSGPAYGIRATAPDAAPDAGEAEWRAAAARADEWWRRVAGEIDRNRAAQSEQARLLEAVVRVRTARVAVDGQRQAVDDAEAQFRAAGNELDRARREYFDACEALTALAEGDDG